MPKKPQKQTQKKKPEKKEAKKKGMVKKAISAIEKRKKLLDSI